MVYLRLNVKPYVEVEDGDNFKLTYLNLLTLNVTDNFWKDKDFYSNLKTVILSRSILQHPFSILHKANELFLLRFVSISYVEEGTGQRISFSFDSMPPLSEMKPPSLRHPYYVKLRYRMQENHKKLFHSHFENQALFDFQSEMTKLLPMFSFL